MNDPENNKQGKGFKGLQSFGSKSPGSAPEIPAIPERKVPELPAVWAETAGQPAQPQPSKSQTAAPSWRGWVIGLGVLGVIVGFFIWAGSQSSSSSSYSTPNATDYQSPPTVDTTPASPPSGPTITMPPVGNGLVLTRDQIRYCVYEDRRIKGAEKVVDNYNQASVNTFNAMVEDYNSRCGNFRYRSGALAPIEREAENIQAQLEQEGRERMKSAQSGYPEAGAFLHADDGVAAAAAAAVAADTYAYEETVAATAHVTVVDLGNSVGADNRVEVPVSTFAPGDTIYAAVTTRTSELAATVPSNLSAKWTYQDGQTVYEGDRDLNLTGGGVSAFQIRKPDGFPAGRYRVEISLDGAVVQSREFEVR